VNPREQQPTPVKKAVSKDDAIIDISIVSDGLFPHFLCRQAIFEYDQCSGSIFPTI
jgi:hypothetical protein